MAESRMLSPTYSDSTIGSLSSSVAPGASTAIQVVVRLRPLTNNDRNKPGKANTEPGVSTSMTSNTVVIPTLSNRFFFDHVFDDSIDQSSVYTRSVLNMVAYLMDGFNITILAYGQTSSGKTYTMGTSGTTNSESDGIIPRAINTIFEIADSMQAEGTEVSVNISYLELYNEDLIDLLVEGGPPESRPPIIIREDRGKIIWTGIKEIQVRSPEDVSELLYIGSTRRQTASTDMNQVSSRSHAIFSVNIVQTRLGKNNAKTVLRSKCHFVDLAGSERLKRTGASGNRAKEGININAGLLALGNVISALGDASKKNTHIPYRDSKLTRLLQDSIGGNSYTMMIACISPAMSDVNETYNTLKYANRARNIKNKLKQDEEDITDTATLKAIIQELNEELERCRSEATSRGSVNPSPIPGAITGSSGHAPTAPMYYLIKRTQVLERDLVNIKRKYATLQSKFVNQRPPSSLSKSDSPPRNSVYDTASIAMSEVSTTSDFHKIIEPVVEEYEQTLKVVERELTLCRNENMQLQTDLKLEMVKIEDLGSKNETQKKIIDDLRSQLEELLIENIRLSESVENNEQTLTESQFTKLRQLESEVQQLTQERDGLKSKADELENENSGFKAATQSSDLESKYNDLKEKLAESDAIRSKLESDLAKLKKEASLVADPASDGEPENDVADASLHLEESFRELEELETAAAQMQQQLSPRFASSECASPERLSVRVNKLEQELEKKNSQLFFLESQLAARGVLESNNDINNCKKPDERTNDEVTDERATGELDVLRTQYKELMVELNQAKSSESVLNTKKVELEETKVQLELQISELKQELSKKMESEATLKNSQTELEKTKDSLESHILLLQQELDDLSSGLLGSSEALEAKIKTQSAEIVSLNAEIKSTQELHDGVKAQLQESQSNVVSLEEQISSREHELNLLKQDCESNSQTIVELEKQLCDRDEKINSLQASLKAAQEEIQEQNDLLSLQVDQNKAIEAENAKLTGTQSQLEKRLSEAKAQLDLPKPPSRANSISQEDFSSIKSQNVELDSQLGSIRSELSASQDLVDALEKEMQHIEAQKEDAITQIKQLKAELGCSETKYATTIQQLEQERANLNERFASLQKEHEVVLERNSRYAHQVKLATSMNRDDEGNSQSSGSRRSKILGDLLLQSKKLYRAFLSPRVLEILLVIMLVLGYTLLLAPPPS